MVSFTKHVKSYFQNTSLHGLQYVGEDGRNTFEKIIWLFLFFCGVVLMTIFFIPGYNIVVWSVIVNLIIQELINISTLQRARVSPPQIIRS